jgi:hypothetical protein
VSLPIFALVVIALFLARCEIGVPRNDECRDVETRPGDPISKECLSMIGKPPASP